METPTTFSSRVGSLLALLVAVGTLACGEGGGGPILPSGNTPRIILAGTWSGTASDALHQFQMTLILTQSGNNISGTMTGTTMVGAPIYNNGTVTGLITPSAFTFTISVPRGGIVDAPSCTASFAATTNDLLTTSMAGTYTGGDTCDNTFAGGRFQLLKQ